jgi:undecaprenyl-diphosphatase
MEALFIAAILGLVEGLTEFIPVSSTGHLIIAGELLEHSSASFNIIIQLGAILAVVFLYKERFLEFFNLENIKKLQTQWKEKSSTRLNLIHIALAIGPILAIGFVSRKFIKEHLFNTHVVIGSLIIVGIIMIIVEKIKPQPTKENIDQITYVDALIIGIGQCFALIPGVSRSGATMLTAMLRRIDVKTSADFSFLISVPVIGLITIYEFIKSYHEFTADGIIALFVGFIVSFFVAIVGIKGFLVVLKRLSLTPFAIYRILFGLFYYFFKT